MSAFEEKPTRGFGSKDDADAEDEREEDGEEVGNAPRCAVRVKVASTDTDAVGDQDTGGDHELIGTHETA